MAEMKPYEPRLFSDNIPFAVADFARWLGADDHKANFYGNRAQEFFKMTPPGMMVDAASDIGRDLRQGRTGPALLNAASAVLNTNAAGKILGGLMPVTRGLQDRARAAAMGQSEVGTIPHNVWGMRDAGRMPEFHFPGGMPANQNLRLQPVP
jgi:hypothetical protein